MVHAETSEISTAGIMQQSRTVTGKVLDPKGETVIGANVMEKGTSNGTITDFDGNFTLNVSPNATLVISYIGYKTQEIPVSQAKAGRLEVTLREDSEVMDEVVVLAVQLKTLRGEFSVYLILAAALIIGFLGISRLELIVETARELGGYIQIEGVYLGTLLKMVGITYIAEFASGICKDAGYSALGVQIEMFGKLSILAVSAPVLLALFETLQGLMG